MILIDDKRYPDLNRDGALAFSDWLVSDEGQTLIDNFWVNGKQLFKATYTKS